MDTHHSCNYKINNSSVICNPRGSSVNGSTENKDYKDNLIVDI